MLRRALALLATLSIFPSAVALADTLRLLDGKSIQNVQVVSEGLKEVTYKEGKSDKAVPSDAVLAVDYEKKPKPIEEAEASLVEEDLDGARETYEAYVEAALAKAVPAQFKWAPPQAAWRALELRAALVDLEGVKAGAKRLIQGFPESRFVPMAYLAKAKAELSSGQATQAQETLGELSGLVNAQSLAPRWALECRLGQIQADASLKPESRRNEFERVQAEARDLPQLQARAQVLIGETFLAEAAANQAGSKPLREKAKEAFEKVVEEDRASRSDLAAAHAGLGETLFLQGADASDKVLLQDALLHLLRVATLFREEGEVVARSFFYAMRCFDLLPDPRRKVEMKRELLARYPSTSWAEQAKKY